MRNDSKNPYKRLKKNLSLFPYTLNVPTRNPYKKGFSLRSTTLLPNDIYYSWVVRRDWMIFIFKILYKYISKKAESDIPNRLKFNSEISIISVKISIIKVGVRSTYTHFNYTYYVPTLWLYVTNIRTIALYLAMVVLGMKVWSSKDSFISNSYM